MSLYHFHVTQIKRSAGQSAIACAAYRAGEKLHSEYYGEDSDYTKKSGVICSEILLPPHAPPEYADRENLWNVVEQAERHPKAQLAYSFDIALQNEFTMEENIALAREFLMKHLVSRGMITDFAVHAPDKDGGIANPHFHVLCPIRPLNPDGTWGAKQHREYVLDEHGDRIKDKNGEYVFNAVPTTDWGSPETLEYWRKTWAEMCNAKFEEKELTTRIDHRSYESQGIEQVPTVHEGPAVRQMETKGILTDKGDLNRMIRRLNNLRRSIAATLKELFTLLQDIKEALSVPQEPSLAEVILNYYDNKNASAWNTYKRVGNLKDMSQCINYIREQGLFSIADLETKVSAQRAKLDESTERCAGLESRLKEVTELLRQAQNYADTKPIYDEWYSIRFKGRKEKFKNEHEDELKKYYAASRKLKEHFRDGRLPITAWQKEAEQLKNEYEKARTGMNAIRKDVQNLHQITVMVQYANKDTQRAEHQRQQLHKHERE
ncbi:MAG: MobA/MobL family protein [Clostridia bacterium]|nr:MobA/MobL family protein [Clostridia bacterium]